MLNWKKHKITLVSILKDIYQNPNISPWLGFKGGTASNLFYNLPRYSVDLDFDLLNTDKKDLIFSEVKKIIRKYGKIKDEFIKENTVLFEFSYGEADQNVKIEISTRSKKRKFEVLNYLGITMKVMAKEDIFSDKLLALTDRKKTALRDVFDIYYFFSQHWEFNEKIIKEHINKNLADYLDDCIKTVESIDNRKILSGLGELVDEKQKDWIRKNLKNEVLFQLRNYQNALKK